MSGKRVRRACARLLFAVAAVLPLVAGESGNLVPYVNPMIGTGSGAPDFGMLNATGNVPPGAAFPLGMVLWSPDTTNAAGGYRYGDTAIQGFSLTHISGRGISCYQDVPFMPVARPVDVSPGGAGWGAYSAAFSHDNETATPGYYGVHLDTGIGVDLTVTRRTGLARFTFDSAPRGALLINTGGSAQGNRDAGTGVRVIGRYQVGGSATSGDCGGWFQYRVYFAAEFDRPFASFGTWNGADLKPGAASSTGALSGAWVEFDTAKNRAVQVKVALSYVSEANAWANLREENPDWDLDRVRASAADAWNARLKTIQVSGGTDEQKTIFYTALYHAFVHPSTFSDVYGDYLGFDNVVHNTGRRTQFHTFAGWDMYRSQIPLMALLAPEAGDMMQSLINDAQQDPGGGLPRWEHANTNSGGMIGDSQDAVIATAYALGARDFDTAAALAAMHRGASQIGTTSGGALVRSGLSDYLDHGYVSTAVPNSASRTLEYATDDFSISQFARALGDQEKADLYLKRAQNWRNLFHDGYLVPRAADGSFEANDEPWNGSEFVEGSIAQYTWMVPFNMRGLFDSMGGNSAAIARLDRHFAELNAGPWSEYVFMGNEPSLKTPWAYVFAGAPWRTQEMVRRIVLQLFRNSPGGLPGNDDLGTLSAWGVFAMVGMYPHVPGVGGVVLGSPLFPSITIQLASGGVIRISAPEAGAAVQYVQSLKLNGCEYNSAWIPWDALAGGGTLEFSLGNTPNRAWGSDPSAAPPSFSAPDAPR